MKETEQEKLTDKSEKKELQELSDIDVQILRKRENAENEIFITVSEST